MHPLIGLRGHSRKYPQFEGIIINVPTAYTAAEDGTLLILVAALRDDNSMTEIDIVDLVLNDPDELRRRVANPTT